MNRNPELNSGSKRQAESSIEAILARHLDEKTAKEVAHEVTEEAARRFVYEVPFGRTGR